MNPEIMLALGLAAIVGLTVLGLAVILIGGILRATRRMLEVASQAKADT